MAPTAQTRAARSRRAKMSETPGQALLTTAPVTARRSATSPATSGAPRPRSRRAQHLLETPRRRTLVDLLDGGEFAHQPVEGGLVDLPLAVGLLGLADIAVEIAHHLGDRRRIAGIDLLLVFLGAAAPHGALGARAPLQLGERR